MSDESLSHSKWGCKCPVVFVPEYRKKVLYGKIRKFLGPVSHELAEQGRSKVLEYLQGIKGTGCRIMSISEPESAEIRHVGSGRVSERENRGRGGGAVSRREEGLQGGKFLGTGLCGFHGGI